MPTNQFATRGDVALVAEKLAGHEKECVERMRHIADKLADGQRERSAMWREMKQGFAGIHARLWIAAGALISVQSTAIAYFLIEYGLAGRR